jgi:predicted metalloprotease with PDZ domain
MLILMKRLFVCKKVCCRFKLSFYSIISFVIAKNFLFLGLVIFFGCRRTVVVESFPDEFVGVGVELKIDKAHPVVVRALAGGPAERAGIEANDVILAVDGISAQAVTLGEAVMRLRGTPGTQVTVTVLRNQKIVHTVIARNKMVKGTDLYRQE